MRSTTRERALEADDKNSERGRMSISHPAARACNLNCNLGGQICVGGDSNR